MSASDASCSGLGTYNPVLGRCTCPVGRSGASCEILALPACRSHAASTAVSCAVRRPLHCECLRQCVAAGAFVAHFNPFCFEQPNAAVALSEVPTMRDESAVFRAWPSLKTVTADEALAVEFVPPARHVALWRCPRKCSEHGACIANWRLAKALDDASGGADRTEHEGFSCKCDSFYSGAACEVSTTPYCWNGCGGRGVCTDGFCKCTPPFFGPGCAYESASPRRAEKARGGGAGFKVHVYDVDPIVLRRVSYGSDPDPIFNTYHVFLSALLSDATSLSPSPEDADMLLMPAFGTNMEKLLEYYEHAADHLAKRFPTSWQRHSGVDHLWLISGDGGGCNLREMMSKSKLRQIAGGAATISNGRILAHYLKLNHSDGSCGMTNRDVPIPPHVPMIERHGYLARGERPARDRTLTFFFAGNVPDKHLVDSMSDSSLALEGYSEGVRQLVWKHHRRRGPAYRIVEHSSTYKSDWSEARFCLAPLGVGWGVRLSWAIAAGCVPILGESQVAPWFGDAVRYPSFSLVGMPKAALPSLHRQLEGMSAETLEQMHEAVIRHRRLFLWSAEAGGLAYNVTMHELCWRALYRRPKVSCAALLPPAASPLIVPPPERPGDGGADSRRGWWRRAPA